MKYIALAGQGGGCRNFESQTRDAFGASVRVRRVEWFTHSKNLGVPRHGVSACHPRQFHILSRSVPCTNNFYFLNPFSVAPIRISEFGDPRVPRNSEASRKALPRQLRHCGSLMIFKPMTVVRQCLRSPKLQIKTSSLGFIFHHQIPSNADLYRGTMD